MMGEDKKVDRSRPLGVAVAIKVFRIDRTFQRHVPTFLTFCASYARHQKRIYVLLIGFLIFLNP